MYAPWKLYKTVQKTEREQQMLLNHLHDLLLSLSETIMKCR